MSWRAVVIVLMVSLAGSGSDADPSTDYLLHCRGCHGPDGAGVPGTVPNMRGQVGRFLRVPDGRTYLMKVPGVSQSELDDASTAELLNWLVRELSAAELPDDFRPFTAAEVSAHRRPPLVDVQGERQRLLALIE